MRRGLTLTAFDIDTLIELHPHLTQCGRGLGLPPCQVSSWSIQPFGHNTPTSQKDRTGQDRTGQTDRQTDRSFLVLAYRVCPGKEAVKQVSDTASVVYTPTYLLTYIHFFGRPFAKRFTICYWTVVLPCSVYLSVQTGLVGHAWTCRTKWHRFHTFAIGIEYTYFRPLRPNFAIGPPFLTNFGAYSPETVGNRGEERWGSIYLIEVFWPAHAEKG